MPTNPAVATRWLISPRGERGARGERDADALARTHWHEIGRLGRHGYASSRLSMLVVLGLVSMTYADAEALVALLAGANRDAAAWLLVLGVPALAAAYRLLLARWDQDQAAFGGGRVQLSLGAWRAAEAARSDAPPVAPPAAPPDESRDARPHA